MGEYIFTGQTLANLVMALLTGYVLYRSRTPQLLQGEVKAYRDKCERLEEENKQVKDSSHAKDIEIADLRARTDLTDLRKGQTAMLTNQAQVLGLAMDSQKTLMQLATTLEAMERRLDKGLVMQKPSG